MKSAGAPGKRPVATPTTKEKQMAGARQESLTGPLYSYMGGMAKTPAFRAKHGHNAKPLPKRMKPQSGPAITASPSTSMGGSIGVPKVKPSAGPKGVVRPYGGPTPALVPKAAPAPPRDTPTSRRQERRAGRAVSAQQGSAAAAATGSAVISQTFKRPRSTTVKNKTIDATVNPVLAARASGKAAVQAARKTGDRSAVKAAKQERRAAVHDAKAFRGTFTRKEAKQSRKAFTAAGGRKLLRGKLGVF
jgi:hypothetical protein